MQRGRVGVDGYNLALPNGTGVATYGVALVETLRSLGLAVDGLFGIPVGRREELREVLFFEAMARGLPALSPYPSVHRALRWASQFRRRPVLPVPETGLVERRFFAGRLPAFDRILSSARLFEKAEQHFDRTRRFYTVTLPDPPAVMHWTYPLPLRVRGAKNVYTLHDLVPLKLPYATLDRKRVYHRVVETICREADHVCTVSESSRQDVIDRFGVAPGRITNTYQSAPVPPLADPGDAGEVLGLERDGYYLFFGAIEPKKNVGRLVEAFLAARTEVPLVIVGARAWQSERDLQLIGGTAKHRVQRLEYLPRGLLMQLVAGARGVLFPSLYEGFGLPVLEAMQLGVPVVTSNTSSLPEVAGEAALLVDPYDTGAVARTIARLDGDASLRVTLGALGRVQAERFSAERYRERLGAMYEGLLPQQATP
jgi:glycosyltransferase involved in cell wall biosynthesis